MRSTGSCSDRPETPIIQLPALRTKSLIANQPCCLILAIFVLIAFKKFLCA